MEKQFIVFHFNSIIEKHMGKQRMAFLKKFVDWFLGNIYISQWQNDIIDVSDHGIRRAIFIYSHLDSHLNSNFQCNSLIFLVEIVNLVITFKEAVTFIQSSIEVTSVHIWSIHIWHSMPSQPLILRNFIDFVHTAWAWTVWWIKIRIIDPLSNNRFVDELIAEL